MNDRNRPKRKEGARSAERASASQRTARGAGERPASAERKPRSAGTRTPKVEGSRAGTRGKAERTAKTERGSKTARGGRVERTGRVERAGRPERTGIIERTGRPERTGETERTNSHLGKSERTSKPTDQGARASKAGGRGERASKRVAVDPRVPRGTRGSARNVARRRFEEAPAPVVRPAPARKDIEDPRERRATTLGRVAKPVERKRPDLSSEPHPGMYLLTTREGSEQDLIDELELLNVVDPPARILAPALVLAPKVPKRDKRPVDLTFARQGFPIVQSVNEHDLDTIAQRISRSLRGQLDRAQQYALHVWVPDSDLGNPLASLAEELEAKIATQLEQALEGKRIDDSALRRLGSLPFAQVCLIDPERAVAGVTYSNAAISLARGGRTRVRVTGEFPSRAARKVEEALAWLGVEPGAGDQCVDLGAAPGGWTYVLANRRAKVIAVDPAKLRPDILAMKGVTHVQQSAFNFQPDVPVDWLFCDMAWRPLEAAALLAKWGRRRWTRMLVANIKLPMTKKAEILTRVRAILEHEGDFKHVKMKQLYHDRDEITVTAHVG